MQWNNATDLSRTADFHVLLENAGGANIVDRFDILGAGGFILNNVAAGAGYFPQSDGTSYKDSTWKMPTSTGVVGQALVTAASGSAGWGPLVIKNASTANQTGFAADQYVTSSNPPAMVANTWTTGGQYKCSFDMTKTAAGTAAPVVTVRIGTAGTTSDTAQLTFTFTVPASGAADTAVFDVQVNIRAIGGSGQVAGICRCTKNAASGGMTGASSAVEIKTATSAATVNFSTATTIGVSFNGGTSFSGTNTIVQSAYIQ
jgi:hypothetical protein